MRKTTVKKTRISRTKAKDIIMNSAGRFITTTHIDAKGELRTINGRYHGLTSLSNIRVVETGSNKFKGVNVNTLRELKANKENYTVR
jgi:predicted transcriptional regulator with HTH domain